MIVAVVPAAGRSARMGQPKLLMTFDGQTLIDRVVTALRRGGAQRVVVVVPPASEPEGPAIADEARRAGAEVLVPEARPAEMRSSVEWGLAKLAGDPPPRLVILTPGDAPGVTAGLVDRLLAVARERPGRIVVPCHGGRRGHPIVVPWSFAVQIPALPAGTGVNALVARHHDALIEVPVAGPEVLADLDTPDDLHRWKLRWPEPRPSDEVPAAAALDRPARPAATMTVTVRLFALAKERAGRPEIRIDLPLPATVADLRAALHDHSPGLGPLWSSALIAVDEEYAGDNVPITAASRLAVIPPVSGGTGPGRTGPGPSSSRDRVRGASGYPSR